jgi:Zn-dependent protease with chaperone function
MIMAFEYRWMMAASCVLMLAGVAPRLGPGPRITTPPHQIQPVVVSTRPPSTTSVQSAPASTLAESAAQPAQQAYNLPPDKLAKARTLSRIETALDIGGSLWSIAVLWLLLASRWASRLAAWVERALRRRWMQGLLFFAVFIVVTTLAALPLDLVGHLVSRHYGISVQGWASWFGDLAKALGISLIVGTPILLLFNWIVRVSPRRYWLWAWLISLPLILIATFASPLIIDPLFNKFEPLNRTHAALVDKLETVVARTGNKIAPERMFLMKASAKSNGLNAYVTGIGASKRFVMWDTATDRMPDDEILFIFGHESGHYVLNHIPKGISVSAVALFLVFWGCAGFARWLARRFGARWQLSGIDSGENPFANRQGFLVLLLVLSAAGFVLQPASNAYSRHIEHEADIYGQEAIHGIVADPQETAVSAFNHLGEAWLEDPNPNPFVEFWEYNHPSVQRRANFAAHYDPWANGGRGRFFEK